MFSSYGNILLSPQRKKRFWSQDITYTIKLTMSSFRVHHKFGKTKFLVIVNKRFTQSNCPFIVCQIRGSNLNTFYIALNLFRTQRGIIHLIYFTGVLCSYYLSLPWSVGYFGPTPVFFVGYYVAFTEKKNIMKEKKEEIWLSSMIKAPTPTEKSKKERDNTKTPPKTSITRRSRTYIGRSVGVLTATPLVWLNRFTSAQPLGQQ